VSTDAPPRIPGALLSAALPDGDIEEAVLGDLHELYLERRDAMGVAAARRWYWITATRVAAGYAGRRLRGVRYGALERRPQRIRSRGDGPGDVLRRIRLAIRSLARSPGFTLPALLILAIGMTAATSIATVVDSIALRPLDLPESHRLVIVCEDHVRLRGSCIASPGNVEDFRLASSSLAELGLGRSWPFGLEDADGTTGVRGGLATAGFLRALGAPLAAGRLFTDDETGPDRDAVVLLSHAFWTSRYGRDPAIVGTAIHIDGEPNEVVGILGSNFAPPFGLEGIELWKPLHVDPLDPDVRGWRGFRAIGRLADGASVASAASELTTIYDGIRARYEEVDDQWRLRVQPLLTVVVGDTRNVLFAFLAAAGLLLLIVCANVANLLLARGVGRSRELAVRAALGAGRGRLVREVVLEGFVLSGAATLIALAASPTATAVLVSLAPPEIPRLAEVSMDLRILAFSALLSIAATTLFALVPAFRATAGSPGRAVRSGARGGRSVRTGRMQSGLVVVELALSIVLLTSAALITRSFVSHLEWEPGFDRAPLLAFSAFVSSGNYDTPAKLVTFYRSAEERMAAVPGVVSVASASAGPLFGGGDGATSVVAEGGDETGRLPSAAWYDVGPAFFETLALPVVQGREITEADAGESGRVAVVNESLARAVWPTGGAVGRVVRLPELDLSFEVVGVVQDVVPLTPGTSARPEIYWSNRQLPRGATYFLVRAAGDPADVAPAVTRALLEMDPDASIGTPRTLASNAERELVRPRFQAAIFLAFALIALLLSAGGVYAVISYSAASRFREMGIRMALGAARGDVLRLMIRTSLATALVGICLGLVVSAGSARLIGTMAPGISPLDPVSFVGAGISLLAITVIATLLPAHRAARADPLQAMRVE